MEPLVLIGVPGLLGGVILALILVRMRPHSGLAVDRPLAPPSPHLINMAHIRIDGLGGAGMLAMAVTVAIFVPRIRTTVLIALALGVALAMLLIAFRRREGPLASSGRHPGAHSMLTIEGVSTAPESGVDRPATHRDIQRMLGPLAGHSGLRARRA